MSSVAPVRPPAPALPWQHAATTIVERKNSLRCEIKVRLLVLPIVAISTPTITRYHKPLREASRIWPTPRNFTGQFLAKKACAPGRLKCTSTVQVSPRHVSDHKSRYLNSSDSTRSGISVNAQEKSLGLGMLQSLLSGWPTEGSSNFRGAFWWREIAENPPAENVCPVVSRKQGYQKWIYNKQQPDDFVSWCLDVP